MMTEKDNVYWLHGLTKEQIEAIEAEFFDERNDHAPSSFVKYLKQVPVARFEEIIKKARISSNVYVVSEVIKCLRYRRCNLESYYDLVAAALEFPNDDFTHTVVTAALWDLPDLVLKLPGVIERLRHLHRSEIDYIVEAVEEIAKRHRQLFD
ncbi:MAG: hypothetical protein H9535_12720 [Ignavibacteria bacterium]|nr:hypothetical protein [Ignavibacteria bacterium]